MGKGPREPQGLLRSSRGHRGAVARCIPLQPVRPRSGQLRGAPCEQAADLVKPPMSLDELLDHLSCVVPDLVAAVRVHLQQEVVIDAAREHRTAAAQDDYARPRVVAHTVEGHGEVAHERAIEGVALVGAVEGERDDGFLEAGLDWMARAEPVCAAWSTNGRIPPRDAELQRRARAHSFVPSFQCVFGTRLLSSDGAGDMNEDR
jgi:hypothetical protein